MACYSEIDACGGGMEFYGIHSAAPSLSSNADGYLGLGFENEQYNTLNQMVEKGMINDKLFGIYTSMSNDTIHSSQIRFGGVNTDLIDNEKDQVWIPTVHNQSWEIHLEAFDFNYQSV
jgi:hypothetical protein